MVTHISTGIPPSSVPSHRIAFRLGGTDPLPCTLPRRDQGDPFDHAGPHGASRETVQCPNTPGASGKPLLGGEGGWDQDNLMPAEQGGWSTALKKKQPLPLCRVPVPV
jgi:hypothetical protein